MSLRRQVLWRWASMLRGQACVPMRSVLKVFPPQLVWLRFAMAAPYQARYVTRAPGEGRAPGLRSLKAYLFESPLRPGGPKVFGESRCIVGPLSVESSGVYWHRWYKKTGAPAQLAEWVELAGGEMTDWKPASSKRSRWGGRCASGRGCCRRPS